MKQVQRAPIVTFMGHVDHGKTSILDVIRESEIQKDEVGGITQSISAYQIGDQDQLITFIDTPGHHSFAQMRARGGQVADIVVLVVAADDGVMPQTQEALNHALTAQVRIIVAINKIDLASANIDKVLKQVTDLGLDIVDYGGTIPVCRVSALTKDGIEDLLHAIREEAKNIDLSVNLSDPAQCIILESRVDDRKGVVAHAIVQQGVLRLRDVLVGTGAFARVKRLTDWRGNHLDEAIPSTPVEILGFNDLPKVGEGYSFVTNTKIAQKMLSEQLIQSDVELLTPQERIQIALQNKEQKEIPLIIKTDTQGTLEVIRAEIAALKEEEVELKIIHAGVGNISENDVLLAVPIEGIVIGFGVDIDRTAENIANQEKVLFRIYTIIYELIDDLAEVVSGEIEALQKQILSQAKVKKIFELSDKSLVAGSEVVMGRIRLGNKAELLRNNEVVAETRVRSLRVEKDEVKEVQAPNECGIKLEAGIELFEGDIIQAISN